MPSPPFPPAPSEKDLAPPPEAVEGSGWLAGVWPSQKPKPHAAAVAPAVAEAPSSSPSPSPPPSIGPRQNGTSRNGDGDGGPTSHAGVAAAAAELNGNGTSSTSSRGAGPQAEVGSEKSVVGATAATAVSANRPREHTAAVVCPDAGAAANGPWAGNGNRKGNGLAAEVTTSPKKPKLNGSASAAAATQPPPPPPPAKVTAGASAAAAGATPASPQSTRRRGSRRPDGYEGPLCPSGKFFSKPQTPLTSPSPSASRSNGGPKRPRSPLLQAPATTGKPPGIDQSVAAAAVAAEASRSTSNGGGLELDTNGGEAGVAEGRGQGQGQGRSPKESAKTAAAAGERAGGSGNGESSPAALGGVNGFNGDAGLHYGQGSTKPSSGLVAAAASTPTGHVTAEPPQLPEDMEVEAPLFSAAAIAAAAAGAGGKVDVEMPLLPAAALEKDGGRVGAAGGAAAVSGGAAVGPTKEATVAEQRSLADLKRRATNIPLRLNPRERCDVFRCFLFFHAFGRRGCPLVLRVSFPL